MKNKLLTWTTSYDKEGAVYYNCKEYSWEIVYKQDLLNNTVTYTLSRLARKWKNSCPLCDGFVTYKQETYFLPTCHKPSDILFWAHGKIEDYYSSMKMGFLS